VKRSRVVIGVALLGVTGAAAAAAFVASRDTAIAYGEDAALRDFREGTQSSTATPRPTPTSGGPEGSAIVPGVYSYATTGYESVDALGGSRHDYPATTTITYSPTACGLEERWRPLEGRFGANLICDGGTGREMRTTQQERTFFGNVAAQLLVCDDGLTLLPDEPKVGDQWARQCTGPDTQVLLAGSVLGLEELQVGGTPVPVVHVLLEGTSSGRGVGTTRREVWLQKGTGLVVKAVGATDTSSDSLAGTTSYEERYEIVLQSLEPAT